MHAIADFILTNVTKQKQAIITYISGRKFRPSSDVAFKRGHVPLLGSITSLFESARSSYDVKGVLGMF